MKAGRDAELERMRGRLWYAQHREQIREQRRQWLDRNGNRERMIEYRKRYRQENRQALRDGQRAYYTRNKIKVAKRQEEYYERNRAVYAEQGAELRAMRQEAGISQTQIWRHMGVASSTISFWERGMVPPDVERYLRALEEIVAARDAEGGTGDADCHVADAPRNDKTAGEEG